MGTFVRYSTTAQEPTTAHDCQQSRDESTYLFKLNNKWVADSRARATSFALPATRKILFEVTDLLHHLQGLLC